MLDKYLHKSFKKISFQDTFFFRVQLMYRSTWTRPLWYVYIFLHIHLSILSFVS